MSARRRVKETGEGKAPRAVSTATSDTAQLETAKQSAMPALIPQPNGKGALLSGGVPGNKGGGRPSSAIRETLRASFEKRIPVLEQVADGKPVDEFKIPFVNVLPHVQCPRCKSQMEPKDPETAFMISIRCLRSARPGDRIKAVEAMGKLGLTDSDTDISNHPEARRFLAAFHTALIEEVSPKIADRVRQRIEQLLGSPFVVVAA